MKTDLTQMKFKDIVHKYELGFRDMKNKMIMSFHSSS